MTMFPTRHRGAAAFDIPRQGDEACTDIVEEYR